MPTRDRQSAEMKTSLPGPKAKEMMERKERHIPRGPFNVVPTFAKEGKGALLTDVDGNRFLDLIGGIETLAVGHTPPKVEEALKEQMDRYLHPCFHIMMYEPYVALAEKAKRVDARSA